MSGKRLLVEIGSVHPNHLKTFDLKSPVYYADFRWDTIMRVLAQIEIRYSDLPKFPEVSRNLSFLVDKDVRFSDINKIANSAERKLLKYVNLIEVYDGEMIDNSKKEYTISFTFRDMEQTLTDNQIDQAIQRILEALSNHSIAMVIP